MGEEIIREKDFYGLKENIFTGNLPMMENSKIIFRGIGNMIVCEEGVTIKNSTIIFEGNGSIVYLSSSQYSYLLQLQIYSDSVFGIGRNNYINNIVSCIISEGMNFLCGDGCLFAKNIKIRTSDHHLIYDVYTKKRINPGKSVYIGDHCWICEEVKLLKGTSIGSGAVLAASAVTSMKDIGSNELWGGIPAKRIKRGICFLTTSPVSYSGNDLKKFEELHTDKYIYSNSDEVFLMDEIESALKKMELSEKKEYLRFLFANKSLNRFYIKGE